MNFRIRYMLSTVQREPHRRRKIMTQYGTIEAELMDDPIDDEASGKMLRGMLDNLVEGWRLAGYHAELISPLSTGEGLKVISREMEHLGGASHEEIASSCEVEEIRAALLQMGAARDMLERALVVHPDRDKS